MSDPLRSALESMTATVDQFLSEAASVAGSWGEIEERISDFATVVAIDQKAAREALDIGPNLHKVHEAEVIAAMDTLARHALYLAPEEMRKALEAAARVVGGVEVEYEYRAVAMRGQHAATHATLEEACADLTVFAPPYERWVERHIKAGPWERVER